MEEFLPSDVARSVYGYLISEGCGEAAKVFLETSAGLAECKQRVKNGKKLTLTNTLLLGRNLTDLLNIACSVHSLVLQANKKKQTGEDKDEGWEHLFDELRSFILADSTTNLSSQEKSSEQTSFSRNTFLCRSGLGEDSSPLRPASQQESQNPDLNCSLSQLLNTPRRPSLERASLADSYKNLVQECNEGLDLSLTPDKTCPSSSNAVSSNVPQTSKPTNAPSTLSFPELEGSNQSVVAFGAVQTPQIVSTVPSNLPPGSTLYKVISSTPCIFNTTPGASSTTGEPLTSVAAGSSQFHGTSTCPALSTSTSSSSVTQANHISSQSVATAVTTCFTQPIVVPTHSSEGGFQLEGISQLPDPPIILLNEQNQPVLPFDSNDPSASFFNVPPSAASTPHPTQFAPQDTAIIIYPPFPADIPVKKNRGGRKARPLRQTRLRPLLPKPPRKDPPDIVHIQILPQQVEGENEEDINSTSDNQDCISESELAKELLDVHTEEEGNLVPDKDGIEESGNTSLHNITNANDKDSEKENISLQCVDIPETLNGSDLPKKENQVKTPKPPVLKKNISRSTPRRNSHVRALSFNTPHKPLLGRKFNTSPKMPKIRFSPNSSKLNHVKRSSLFKSPPNKKINKELSLIEEDLAEASADDDSEQEEDVPSKSPLTKLPIATRSPAPKLSTAWKEVNDVTINETPSKVLKLEKAKETPVSKPEKPQWDEKIRSFICGDFVDPVPPPKKEFKGKRKESMASLKKETGKTSKTKATGRRSQKTRKMSESPIKSPIKPNNKNRSLKLTAKQSPRKLKSGLPIVQSKPGASKSSREFFNSTASKRNKKIITPAIVQSSSDDTSSSSDETVSKSVKSAVKNPRISSSFNKSSENIKLNSNCQNNQSQTNCGEVVSKTTSGSVDTSNQILLDDLVVSSNSCFPSTADESNKEQNIVEPSLTNTNQRKVSNEPMTNDNANDKSISPKFALPIIPVLETPLKDIQSISLATPVLNTPFLKTIRQETSVLEEDLLLTPSLPPTPQITSPRTLCRTPAKPLETEEIATAAPQNYLPQKVVVNVDEPAPQINDKVEATNQIGVIDTDSDTSVDDSGKQTISASQNRSSSFSKGSLTSSSDSSDEETMKSFLNLSKIKQTAFKPTIKTRIIQGPVQKKAKEHVKKKKIYTTTDSSDEENSDTSLNKTKTIQPQQESNQSMANLRSMLLENERKRIESLSKTDNIKKPSKTLNKSKPSKLQKKAIKQSRSPKNISLKEKENKPVQFNKSPKKPKMVSPAKNLNKNENKIIQTPEKIRELIENDLLRKERQHLFGEDLQLSSETDSSDSDKEIFEKKKLIQQKNLTRAVCSKTYKAQEVVLSDESSNELVSKDKSNKSVRFETKTQIKIFEESNNVSRSEEVKGSAQVEPQTNVVEEMSEKNQALSAVSDVTSEHGTNSECTENSSVRQSFDKSSSPNENISLLEKSQTSKDSQGSQLQRPTNIQCAEDIVQPLPQPIVGSGFEDEILNGEKERDSFNSRNNNETNVHRPVTNDFSNSVSQNASSDVIETTNKDDYIPEDHINVISNDVYLQNNKAVSLNLPKFDPDYKAAFETENGVMTISFSSTMFQLQLPLNIQQEPLKRVSQKPRRGIDGKRRIKLTPVGEGKYEQKLKVDYDIIDGKIISTRERRQKSNDEDVLDCTCSTIDSVLDSTNETYVSLSRNSFEGAVSNAKNSKKKLEEKESTANNTSDHEKEKTKTLSGCDGPSKHKMVEKECSQPLNGLSVKKNKSLNSSSVSLNKKPDLSSGVKEGKLKQESHCLSDKQSSKGPTYQKSSLKSPIDKRKEIIVKHRKQERDSPDRFDQKDYTKHLRNERREDDRRRYTERRRYRSPDRYHRSSLSRRRDSRNYSPRSPPPHGYTSHRNDRYPERRRYDNRVKKPHWKDVDAVEERGKKSEQGEDGPKTMLDPRAQQAQLTTYSDVEKDSSSDEVDSLMDFAVMTKSKEGKRSLAESSQSSPGKVTVARSGQPTKRKVSTSEESASEASQAKKKLKMEEKDMRKAKSVLKHKMADMLNVLHPDTSNEAS